MRQECRERFPRHCGLAIPTYFTERAWRTYRDAFRDRLLTVSFEVGGGEKRSRRMRNPQYYVSGKSPMLWRISGMIAQQIDIYIYDSCAILFP